VLQVAAYGVAEHALFEVAALADQILDGVAVRAPDRLLLDDRPLINLGGHEVARRADQLHAALVPWPPAAAWSRTQQRYHEVAIGFTAHGNLPRGCS
jgi:hypothetical protein